MVRVELKIRVTVIFRYQPGLISQPVAQRPQPLVAPPGVTPWDYNQPSKEAFSIFQVYQVHNHVYKYNGKYPNVRFYLQFGYSWKLFVALYIEVIPLFLCTWKLFLCCYGEQIKFSVK